MPHDTRASPRSQVDPELVPAKKLTSEQLQKSVERLTVSHERKQETGSLLKPNVLNKSDMNNSVDRLYTVAVERKKTVMASLEAKTIPPPNKQVLDNESMTNSVQRVYSQAMQHKKDVAEKLKTKHISDPCARKKLSKTDQQACNERAYTTPLQRKKDTEDHLVEKYISATVTKFKVC